MSSIYGTTRDYNPEVLEKKHHQICFREGKMPVVTNYNGDIKYMCSAVEVKAHNLVVTFDGNIYNKRQLRNDYLSENCSCDVSDSQILGLLYAKLGVDCVKLLNGDFAFVIYDGIKHQLFGAVDRLGDKPLFIHHGEKGFEWGSQLLPLCIGNRYDLDCYARQCYFTLQYIPAPYTIVKQIRKMGAGESFVYDLERDEMTVTQYWDLYSNSCGFKPPKSYEEALNTCNTLIEDAVRLRLDNGTTQGLFLSGGIDSSIIAKYAIKYCYKVEGFSVGFEEKAFDESEYASRVAEQYGIHLNCLLCSPSEALRVIEGLQNYYDEPMGDYSSIPTSFLCEKTGRSVKIALGGDGGDEMFFGYPRYLRYAGRKKYFNIPKPIRVLVASMARMAGEKRISESLALKDIQHLYLNRRLSNDAELFDAFDVQQSIPQIKYLYGDRDLRRAFNDFDIKTLMCYGYNVKLDRAAARGRLDVRAPMLDYRIVEYTRLLPIDYCYNKEVGQKRVLRDILFEDFDRSFFERRKQGFGVPLGRWFRGGLREYLCDIINDSTIKDLPDYDPQKLISIRDRHIKGEADQTTLLWLCVNYLKWYNIFKKLG